MIGRSVHLVVLGASVAGLQLAISFGGGLERIVAYTIAVALGVAIYVQGDYQLVPGSVFGNVLLGYAAGTVLGLAIVTALLSWLLSIPVDFALWRSGLLLWGSWAGVGTAVLSSFFVVGMVAMVR